MLPSRPTAATPSPAAAMARRSSGWPKNGGRTTERRIVAFRSVRLPSALRLEARRELTTEAAKVRCFRGAKGDKQTDYRSPMRPARLATVATSSCGSIGLATCTW